MAWPITPEVRLPLPSGQGRHRSIVVAQIGVAHEGAVLLVEDVVDAAVELILAVGFDAGAHIVVRARRVGQRIVLQAPAAQADRSGWPGSCCSRNGTRGEVAGS